MKWLRIQDYIFPIDKILFFSKGDTIATDAIIFITLDNDRSFHFSFENEQERDWEFDKINNSLQW